jgi:hypothetical protein
MPLTDEQRARVAQLGKQPTITAIESGYLEALNAFWTPNAEDAQAITAALAKQAAK